MRLLILFALILSFTSCQAQEECEVQKIANVYPYWGQSNMASVADYTEWSDITPIDSRIKIWNGSSFVNLVPQPYTPPYTVNGIELEHAHTRLKNLHPNQDVFIIKRAVGSTGVWWHWNVITSTSGRGFQLSEFKIDIQNALNDLRSQGYTIKVHRIFSFIGETDSANATANNFDVEYMKTSNEIRAELGDMNIPITLYKIWISEPVQNSFPFPFVDVVRDKSDLLNGVNGVSVIETKDIFRPDGVHLPRGGYRALGNKGFTN